MTAVALRAMAHKRRERSFDPNEHMLALIMGPAPRASGWSSSPFDVARTYQIILATGRSRCCCTTTRARTNCALINPHPVAYVFPDAAAREVAAERLRPRAGVQ
jgi:hypothetical protein